MTIEYVIELIRAHGIYPATSVAYQYIYIFIRNKAL